MNFKPLFDRVVIKPEVEKHVANCGIVLPETSQEKPQVGTVIAVGDGESMDNDKNQMKVNIGDRVQVGDDCILHHGVSLGADGFSFVTENPNNIEQAKKDGEIKENDVNQVIFKIPSIGSVVIGNNVEIGANTAIDRGTIEDTIVGDNTKIDDLVMIGHNCRIGKGCMIVSQVGIAGSCVIGDRVVIAGQAGLADHLNIGDDSIIAAQAGVSKSFPAKSIVIGSPAMPRKEFIKQMKLMKDAGDLITKFKKYEPLLKTFLEEQEPEA